MKTCYTIEEIEDGFIVTKTSPSPVRGEPVVNIRYYKKSLGAVFKKIRLWHPE